MLFNYDENGVHEITVEDYLKVRGIIETYRSGMWSLAEEHNFADEYYSEDDIEAFDFVIDTLTELAIELNKKK